MHSACIVYQNQRYPLLALQGEEAWQQAWQFRIEIESQADLPCAAMVGQTAELQFQPHRQASVAKRRGTIRQIQSIADEQRYLLCIEAPLAELQAIQGSAIYYDKTAAELVKAICAQVPTLQIVIDAIDSAVIPYFIQYQESAWQALQRILSEYAWHIVFDHDVNPPTCIFTDSLANRPHYRIAQAQTIAALDDEYLWGVVVDVAHHEEGKQRCYHAFSNSCSLQPNFHCAGDDFTVLHIQHAYKPSEGYKNTVRYVLSRDLRSLPSPTSALSISGVQLARVVTSDDMPVHTDQYARIPIKLIWDIHHHKQEVIWSHYTQPFISKDAGIHFLPRSGEDVLIRFAAGFVPKAYIISNGYRHEQVIPVSDRLHHSKISLQSIGCDRQSHAIIFDDTPEAEHLTISTIGEYLSQVCGQQTVRVAGDIDVLIGGDHHLDSQSGKGDWQAKTIQLHVGSSELRLSESHITLKASSIECHTLGGDSAGAIARLGDTHHCSQRTHDQPHHGGTILAGAENVQIEGKPVARVGDKAHCDHEMNVLAEGVANFTANGKPIVTVNKATKHGGKVKSGSGSVSAAGFSYATDADEHESDWQINDTVLTFGLLRLAGQQPCLRTQTANCLQNNARQSAEATGACLRYQPKLLAAIHFLYLTELSAHE